MRFSSKIFIIVLIHTFGVVSVKGQSDSIFIEGNTKKSASLKKAFAVPTFLMSAGILAVADDDLINRFEIYEERNEWMPDFRTRADDFLQYEPVAGMLVLNALGVKGGHDFSTQIALLVKSELVMAAMVFPLKRLTAMPRPDTKDRNSFPSGHTAQAFVAATFFHKEYGKRNPLYSVLAFGTASGIGVLRVMNNRHWASDVLAGAGIGILATNLVYLMHRDKKLRNGKQMKRSITFLPVFGSQNIGFTATIWCK